jgi:hypothetical protein
MYSSSEAGICTTLETVARPAKAERRPRLQLKNDSVSANPIVPEE